jgi:hypothetical protein
MKLDFRKAFDTVSWECLFDTLRVRGFDQTWIKWMHNLMESAKIAVLLNSVPDPWIQIKRGLRQGDHLSPLLFIILVDILQQVIKHFSFEGRLLHPIISDLSCPVIQYVDDTLILIQGCPEQARILKEILDCFSSMTG